MEPHILQSIGKHWGLGTLSQKMFWTLGWRFKHSSQLTQLSSIGVSGPCLKSVPDPGMEPHTSSLLESIGVSGLHPKNVPDPGMEP